MINPKIRVLMEKTADLESVMRVARDAAVISTLGSLAYSTYSNIKSKLQNDVRRKALIEDLIKNDPVIKNENKDKVMEYYATIFHIAPHISADKNTVRDLLHNFITFDKVDLNSIKLLADAEKSLTTVHGTPMGGRENAFMLNSFGQLAGNSAKAYNEQQSL